MSTLKSVPYLNTSVKTGLSEIKSELRASVYEPSMSYASCLEKLAVLSSVKCHIAQCLPKVTG